MMLKFVRRVMNKGKASRLPLLKVCYLVIAAFALLIVDCRGGGGSGDSTAAPQPVLQQTGALKVLSSNPRYFTDGNGKAIYLAGSHNWYSVQDNGLVENPSSSSPVVGPLTYISDDEWNALLGLMQTHHHNFTRLWINEGWMFGYGMTAAKYAEPLPYARTGPGTALDGKPKFDLSQFNQAYFDRLRSRVSAAKDGGIYVSVMLFQGFGMDTPETWKGHPFNGKNNVNAIDGDLNGDGIGSETHTLQNSVITALQEKYVKKVIDTVNDLDNVLYEIANEDSPGSASWQYHMIDVIHDYEKTKPKQHPVGMTMIDQKSNSALFGSKAEWISPTFPAPVDSDPSAADGTKVILLDTDHLAVEFGSQAWAWKSFLRGYNLLYMDNLTSSTDKEATRLAMGQTLAYANKMNLAAMTPRDDLSSTSHCLANPGQEYLVYQPSSETSFSVNLVSGTYSYEWFNPSFGWVDSSDTIKVSSGDKTFTPPFRGDAVLYLKVVSEALTAKEKELRKAEGALRLRPST